MVMAATAAHAQSTESQTAATAVADEPSTTGLTDIVVTARRRAENLQDVPLSVTAFTPELLTQNRIQDRTDLANFTPSLISITGGYPKEFAFFALRGQGPAFGSTPGVINYFAEVAAPTSIDGRTGTYFDLANVQVLAGPQGTLFGKNATGGNILFEPQRPTNRHEGYVQLEYGNLRDVRTEFAVNVPIVDDKVLLRVAGEVGRRDGYTKDVGPNFAGKDYDNLDYQSVRASLTLRPAAGLELYTVGRYYHSDNNGPGTVLEQFNPNLGVGLLPALGVFPGLATAVADQDNRGIRRVSYDLDQFSKTDYWQVINHATLEVSDRLTLKNIVSYSEATLRYGYDYDATPFPIGGQTSRTGGPTQAPTFFTEELQLQGRLLNDAVNFTAGGYYDRGNIRRSQSGLFTQFPLSFFAGQIPARIDNSSRSYAAFGQATIDLGKAGLLDGLSITGGLRHTWDETQSETQILTLPVTGGTAKFKYLSYNVSADYAVTTGVHVYATSRDAYKAGGVNGPVPEGSSFRTFPPERLQDLEIGLKSQTVIGGVPTRFNVAAYRGNYTNIQRTTPESISGAILNVTRSAAKGRIQGVEVTTAIVPFTGLTLNGSYSYTDAKYTRVEDATAGALLAGAAFPYTPKHKATVGAAYEAPVAGLGTIALSASYAYQSRFSTAQNNLAQVAYLPGYGTLSLRAGVRDIGGQPLDLTAFMANATDKDFATGLQDLYNSGGGTVTYTYSEPRTYGLQLRYRFGG
jgi:iron complex outermembrane receptor protein